MVYQCYIWFTADKSMYSKVIRRGASVGRTQAGDLLIHEKENTMKLGYVLILLMSVFLFGQW